MIGFYFAERIILGGGIKRGMKNDSETKSKIYFRQDFMLTTHFMLTTDFMLTTHFMLTTQFTCTKQLQVVLINKGEIRECSYFI